MTEGQSGATGATGTGRRVAVTRTVPECSEEGCGQPKHVRGLCQRHWREVRAVLRAAAGDTCSADGCEGGRWVGDLCHRHYDQRRYRERRRRREAGREDVG